ncbi:MAG: phosphoenolpyruvate--protein phosphotransferase [Treponema porcinum]|uniref:phosphoenolpyruvate--protein phosphotransferase n=1 Tax=Treponema porcinum TaxID=261392 RepID=UPI00235397E5|nr:phosphoenolpyruvate--protein phosphotransferase [Treponema porcinum]MCI6180423.1 phosphoenolpyruvate--protein phosphotransferase [Treponema porcinum]MCI6722076.1 phosphoenolpyruvate--protein phosphotransferase [Treponema porcinum]MCI6983197.1 phosphoenolpyruvate--protein phosphotransferase [Treponema porcinum]MCI7080720.1 phosphoenolpyruvate--protein phosphotransferase [Treponema porcinum]MCI7545680.1 phosphoenolpyruvate--protein phosphotransferase [Treponema porcinum]
MEVFLGVSAADGAGIGSAFLIPDQIKRAIPQTKISKEDIEEGWERFTSAKTAVAEDITEKLSKLPVDKSTAIQREIFEAYILMLNDPVFLREVRTEYETTLFNIEYTLNFKSEEYAARLRNAGNDYLAERAQDITDIFGRVLDEMLGIHTFDINEVPDGSVIIASSLSPTETIILSKRKIAGLALTEGGISSHVVILARNYGIPTVVGLHGTSLRKKVQNGQMVIVDAECAELLADPDEETIAQYRKTIEIRRKEQEFLTEYLDKPALTKDGERFTLYANIGSPEEAETALKAGADGIGLFRTEFLYMAKADTSHHAAARSFNEDEQFETYKHVLTIMKDKPVTIRTLDAGGDKLINSVDIPSFNEKNPLMGMRAIRLSLAYPQVLKTQLRALYRASVYGKLRIMLPLITSAEQVEQSLVIVDEVKKELAAENIPFDDKVPVGIMIETAAAALTSDCLAKTSDFFSLGTNDLTQYTLGVDRENSNVSGLYDEFNLAVLRLIAITITNAKKYGINLSVCGEMAGRHDSILVLGGLGIRSLSMSPNLISRTKHLLSQFTVAELQAISSKRLNKL